MASRSFNRSAIAITVFATTAFATYTATCCHLVIACPTATKETTHETDPFINRVIRAWRRVFRRRHPARSLGGRRSYSCAHRQYLSGLYRRRRTKDLRHPFRRLARTARRNAKANQDRKSVV